MKKLILIANYTVRDVLKSRVLFGIALLGFGVLIASGLASTFAFGNPKKVALDLGLGLMTLSQMGIALFMGVNLITKEISDRTIYLTVSRGVSRVTFLCGKVLGLSVILLLNELIISIFVILIYKFNGGELNYLFFMAVLLTFLSSLILLNVVIFFSLFTNVNLSIVYSIIIFCTGSVINETALLDYVRQKPLNLAMLKFFGGFLPNFSVLNIRDFVFYNNPLSGSYLLSSALYGFGYSFVLLGISCYILHRKDLN